MAGNVHAGALAGLAAIFVPSDPPREGRIAFWDPGGDLPLGVGETQPNCEDDRRRRGVARAGARVELTASAERVPVDQAVAVGRPDDSWGSSSAAFWGAAALIALQLVARGRLLPGVSPGGHDAWRVGPLDAADVDRVLALAESIPFEARCLPLESARVAGAGRGGACSAVS